ncbi:hypothetical protein [Kutzneria buriramensis]|uniref:Uncharacterized protein n=1 Tax=Kutzneria buriramensis TaxID=1045776 RepID=A0A3E0G5K3_9PSEU|nr:hypothetical protein [Kutzneria buriramensis]REH18052.1 hypothetical protein BCF44_13839 [Kutzneria buriramensis]
MSAGDHDSVLADAVAAWVLATAEGYGDRGRSPATPELTRLRAAHAAREALLAVVEAEIDRAIEAARQRTPDGHTWAEIGGELGVTGQAVGKRARERSLTTKRTLRTPEQRAVDRRRTKLQEAAFVRACRRWPAEREIREVVREDGVVGYVPASRPEATPEWAEPVAYKQLLTPESTPAVPPRLPRRVFANALERARSGMAGVGVYRPELLRRG